jgi:hypothetical protein
MGVVVDDGPNAAEPNWSRVAVLGAEAAPGSTSDLQAMSAVGETPTQNDSGLVCAINNFPADALQNCLNTAPGGQFFYWSYWDGDPYTNTWTYANAGPASHTVSSGQTYVEGWRYQDPGADNPSATKPSVTPSAAFAQACPGVTPVPAGATGGGSGGSGGGGAAGSAPTGGGQSSSGPTTTTTAAPSSTQPTSARTAGGGNVATTTHPGSGAGPTTTAPHNATTTTAGGATSKSDARSNKTRAVLAASGRPGASGGGDPALPIVVVAGVILLLGGLAWWRWHRRPVDE